MRHLNLIFRGSRVKGIAYRVHVIVAGCHCEQVQIHEDIMGDPNGQATTGILTGVRYLKDNRLLPHGFAKQSPDKDIAVIGEALSDPNFTGDGNRVRYSVNLGDVQGPVRIEAELWYQPIGYRWANNLKPYNAAAEPRRFTGF